MNSASDKYNALASEVRAITSAIVLEHQIRGLQREKVRLTSRYNRSLEEINEHLSSCKQDLETDLAALESSPPQG